MTLHREWFYEYEMCEGDFFLGVDWPTKITGCGKVKLQLKEKTDRTLLGVLYIPNMERT